MNARKIFFFVQSLLYMLQYSIAGKVHGLPYVSPCRSEVIFSNLNQENIRGQLYVSVAVLYWLTLALTLAKKLH